MAIKDRFWDPNDATENAIADYALALLSEASYQVDDTALIMWSRIFDMPLRTVVITPGILIPNFVIAGHADRLVVAIPGTIHFSQMFDNIVYSAQRENADFGIGLMHSFFLWCAEGIVPFMLQIFGSLPDLREVTFVGHSLGGAVAQLLADWTVQNTSITVKQCVTFNSPRVGNPAWADRARTYPTKVYYSTRDMVCELPTRITPSTNASTVVDFGFVDGYRHRGENTSGSNPGRGFLTPVISTRDIKLTWWASIAGKIGIVGSNAGARAVAAETAKKVFENAARISGRVYFASWFLPLPVWIDEHRMFTMVQNFEAAIVGEGFLERAELKNLHDFLGALEPPFGPIGYPQFNSSSFPYAIVPPASFRQGEYPAGNRIADLVTPLPGTRMETIEASIAWETSNDPTPLPELVMIDDSFFAAFAAADTGPRGTSPLTSPTPIEVDIPARPHWFYRGGDRRLLQKLAHCFDLIEKRDLRAWDETLTASLSTREQMFDLLDEELQADVAAVRDRVDYLLGLTYDA